MTEPIGWASMRHSLHYKTVFPTVPDVGMQATLHRNLSKRLQPREMIEINQQNIEMARRILHRQRVALKLFSGSRLNLKGSTPHETSSRLHRQPMRSSTCPDGFYRENSETFSNMRSEGSTLLTEASLYGPPRESLTRESLLPNLYGRNMSTIPGSARSIFSDQNISTYDPEKAPDSRGYLVKLKRPIVYKKKYTEAEVQNIVRRLTDYDPETHPAESKGTVRDRPAVVTQVPRQSMSRIKKCTAEEVQQIVERLYSFDNSKWPPESRDRKPQIHPGRPPRQIQTAPAGASRQPGIVVSAPPPVIPQIQTLSFEELAAASQGASQPPPSVPATISEEEEREDPTTDTS
ncbi:uncharacterized protein LOC127864595 [Dreissena polymorpha]|uniref:Uncharacterized protein n=1 Tax=Dreissena polymorpha TaxID=45954 RepID=A0A9D4S961_DREPO|nr:uncharacterized protein LOC127864595 [Dreissena polymorpha]XP_052260308.1 uncharacterized protein LOC127864595 [Dreissena polymorpha]XP_052260310.1 uncharacterized protein LOC127864595 [Dreissena polymorpha]XP_052260311.1 uncharacterized protein LOC127864595 [Dreissena polymorpha]XP_052260312.1 uncharacterized protein LOC127864595 [Dreissena polymorpha]XP_052260313.1 uncharacterized protein LOC127864595 [Dreissena polymorpha]XP_052260314.1 uncharacterized protein LOC127864595 [Dreissena po